jgi:hypothetical protein
MVDHEGKLMARFYIDGYCPPVEGKTLGERWNGWATPYFERPSADKIVSAHRAFYGDIAPGHPSAFYDEQTRAYNFYDPNAQEWDEWPLTVRDGVETWAIGAFAWCWELEADDLSM